jgi:hypothetical protein
MRFTRSGALTRAVLASLFGAVFLLAAITAPVGSTDAGFVAPMIALIVGGVALLSLAWSAFIVAGGIESTDPAVRAERAKAAWPGYRIARWGVLAIPVFGVFSGLIAWLFDKDNYYLLVMAWSTAIVLLVHLLHMRHHGLYLAAMRAADSAPQEAPR